MGILETAVLTLVMAVVVKLLENKITVLVHRIKGNPFESFVVVGIISIIALSCIAIFV